MRGPRPLSAHTAGSETHEALELHSSIRAIVLWW